MKRFNISAHPVHRRRSRTSAITAASTLSPYLYCRYEWYRYSFRSSSLDTSAELSPSSLIAMSSGCLVLRRFLLSSLSNTFPSAACGACAELLAFDAAALSAHTIAFLPLPPAPPLLPAHVTFSSCPSSSSVQASASSPAIPSIKISSCSSCAFSISTIRSPRPARRPLSFCNRRREVAGFEVLMTAASEVERGDRTLLAEAAQVAAAPVMEEEG